MMEGMRDPGRVLAIDPGPKESAFVVWDGDRVLEARKEPNDELLERILVTSSRRLVGQVVIEQIRSYGMAVSADIFDTVEWSGRFHQASKPLPFEYIPRMMVKMHLCHDSRAKDSNIRQALIDRFGLVPTKKVPNPCYGDHKLAGDEWQAFALAVTYFDKGEASGATTT